MTPTQLKNNATRDDIIMLGAFFEIQAEGMDAATKAPNAPAPAPARRSRRR
jgi:hypothetical protein